ncbi:MAG: hypothetical protein ACXVLQ_01360 [Bacteriovorax sp.]
MKTIMMILSMATASAFASTIDGHRIPVFGTEAEENFSLATTQTRIAYRQDSVARTCYRTELAGYRNVCDYYPEVRCYETRDSARVCQTVPVPRCQPVADYRQVPYTCYQTVSTPYEVVDHQVKANFNVKITKAPKEPTDPTGASCSLGFIMEGEMLKSSADCNDYLVLSTENKKTDIDQMGTIVHNYDVAVKLLDTADTLAPLEGGIGDLHLEGHTLAFRTGDLSKNANFSLKLFIERKHLLKGNETLIDRNITASEYAFEKINGRFGIVKVNLDKLLGGLNDKKKHVIKVNMNVALPAGTLLNTKAPALNAEASITVKN